MDEESWNRLTRVGVGWSVTAFAAGRALTFVATLILARLLVPADFGVVAAILVYLSLLELVSDLGMKATVVYEQERGYSDRLDTAFSINLAIAALLAGAGVLAAGPVAGFFGVPDDAALFRLGALSILLTGLGNIHDAVLLRRLAFRRRMIPDLARGISRGLTSIVLALAGLGAAALVIGTLAGQAVWSAAQWTVTRFRPRLRIDWRVARSMTGYGAGAAALEIFGVLAQRADAVVIGKVLGPSALGIYTIAFRVPELLISSTAWSVSKVTFPALSRARATGRDGADGSGVVQPTLTVIRWQALAALPAATLIAIASAPMIVVLFGDEWGTGAGVMAAIAVMTGFDAVTLPLGDALKATARQRLLVAINLVLVPLSIAAMVAAAPAGIVPVAWVAAVGSGVHLVIVSAVCRRALGVAPAGLMEALRPAIACSLGCALGAGAARLLVPGVGLDALGAAAGAGLAGSALALLLFAPATASELWSLRRMLPRRPSRTPSPPPAGPAGERRFGPAAAEMERS